MIRHIILTLSAFFLLCVPAYAQSVVNLRTGVHDGYTRAVFDWPSFVPYEVERTAPGELVIDFHAAADMTFADIEQEKNSNILDVKQLSYDGTNLQVSLKILKDSNFRHFTVNNRVVIDVFDPPGVARKKIGSKPPKLKLEKRAPKFRGKGVEKSMKAVSVEESEPLVLPSAVRKKIEQQGEKITEPHVITMSLTEAVGLAVFRRLDWLWFVVDDPDSSIPPQISGAQAGLFSDFQRLELKGGVGYRTKLPLGHETMKIYGEGGGLIWRVVITPHERKALPVKMKRSFSRVRMVRGGMVTWPFFGTTKVIEIPDPSVGDVLKVVTVEQSDQFSGNPHHMVDFNTLESIIGMVVQPKVDDLDVNLTGGTIEFSRPGGLAVSSMKDVTRRKIREDVQESKIMDKPPETGDEVRRIFDFDGWMMGGLQALDDNQRILLAGMVVKDNTGRVQDLLTLAKMNLSNDRGAEALGFLSYAAAELPDIADSLEFRALRGASAVLSGKFEMAFKDLFYPTLMDYGELDYWRAYTLASLEDWQRSAKVMPDDFTVLIGYPRLLLEKIGLKLAEVALRSGDVETAERVLSVLQRERSLLSPWTLAGVDYLKGEAHRQSGEYDEAKQKWGDLSKGHDDFYRAKSGLALTLLGIDTGEMTTEQAVDRLEGLRYAWRGDELESQINFILGRLYLKEDRYLKGFTILRDATSMKPDSDIGKEIAAFMKNKFKDLLINDKDLTPLDAVQLYEEFRELTPIGDDGNKLVQKLAERLVQADLLARAAAILEHQVEFRLKGEEKARVAVRLGVIDLIDKNARKSMKYLAGGRDMYSRILKGAERKAKLKEIDLLRARGLSQLNRTEEALKMLNKFEPDPVVNRLRADIAWKAGLWEDTAEALQDLILDEALDLNRPLTPDQSDLILNRAVALNLSGNRVALNNMRRRYEYPMKKTAKARLFDVVTRPRKTSILADRSTIESIVNEVDMFSDFLKSYRKDAEAISN